MGKTIRRLVLLCLLGIGPLTAAARADGPVLAETPANLARVNHMTYALVEFVMLHELGHFIIDAIDAPVLGREEDAADRFAALFMTPPPRPEGLPPERFDPAVEPDVPGVIWTTAWWHLSHKRTYTESGREPLWWDEHGIDEQRSRQIMCLVYGADPARFEAAFAPYLPPERRDSCIHESAANARAWSKVIAPNIAQPDERKFGAHISYGEAPEPLSRARATLEASGVLDKIAGVVRELRVPSDNPQFSYSPEAGGVRSILVPDPTEIEVAAMPCQDDDGTWTENALWDAYFNRLTLCYGLVAAFEAFARDVIARTPTGQSELQGEAPTP